MTLNFVDYAFKAAGASTDRTLPTRLKEIFNVKDYGAVGDGSHDDTAAIRNTFAACINTMSTTAGTLSGGQIYFPPGIYRVTETINMTQLPEPAINSMEMVGAGRDATTIVGNLPGTMVIYYGNMTIVNPPSDEFQNDFGPDPGITRNMPLRDMTIKNESLTPVSRAVWYKQAGSAVMFKNLRFIGACGFGTHYNTFHPVIHDCIAECIGTGISDSLGFYLQAGDVSNCSAKDFAIGFSYLGISGHMKGCRAVNCGIGFDARSTAAPLPVGGSLGEIEFFGNVAENCGTGFYLQNYSGIFAGNISKNSTVRGFDVHDATNSHFYAHTFDGSNAARIQPFDPAPQNFVAAFPATWTLPDPAHPAAKQYYFLDHNRGAQFVWFVTLDQLAGQAPVEKVLFEPWTANVFDGTDAATNFGNVVTAGGSGRYKIRYDGTNWIRIG